LISTAGIELQFGYISNLGIYYPHVSAIKSYADRGTSNSEAAEVCTVTGTKLCYGITVHVRYPHVGAVEGKTYGRAGSEDPEVCAVTSPKFGYSIRTQVRHPNVGTVKGYVKWVDYWESAYDCPIAGADLRDGVSAIICHP
jgi:hypothetical protein